MNRDGLLSVLACLCLVACLSADDGKLQAVRDSVRTPDSAGNGGSSGSSGSNNSASSGLPGSDDSPLSDAEGKLFYYMVASPFAIPKYYLNDDYSVDGYFAPFPYADERRGLMRLDPTDEYHFHHADHEDPGLAHASPWLFRFAVDESNDFNGLNRVTGHFLVDSNWRFGLDANLSELNETLHGGRSDEMWLGNANLVFRFAQSEKVQMRSGIGVNIMSDRYGTNSGLNFTYGGDYFPAEPFVISSQVDAGRLGSAWLLHGRATVGATYRWGEAFLGYDFLRIGSTNLQGPVAGLRFWF